MHIIPTQIDVPKELKKLFQQYIDNKITLGPNWDKEKDTDAIFQCAISSLKDLCWAERVAASFFFSIRIEGKAYVYDVHLTDRSENIDVLKFSFLNECGKKKEPVIVPESKPTWWQKTIKLLNWK